MWDRVLLRGYDSLILDCPKHYRHRHSLLCQAWIMFESSFLYRPSLIPGCLLYSTYTAIPLCLLQGWPHLDSSRTPLGRFSAKRHKCIDFVQLLVPNYFAGQLRAPQRTSLTEKPLQCKRRFYVGLFKVFLRTHRAISVAAETCTLKTIYK